MYICYRQWSRCNKEEGGREGGVKRSIEVEVEVEVGKVRSGKVGSYIR